VAVSDYLVRELIWNMTTRQRQSLGLEIKNNVDNKVANTTERKGVKKKEARQPKNLAKS